MPSSLTNCHWSKDGHKGEGVGVTSVFNSFEGLKENDFVIKIFQSSSCFEQFFQVPLLKLKNVKWN